MKASQFSKKQKKFLGKKRVLSGDVPGMLAIGKDGLKPYFHVIAYDAARFVEETFKSPHEIKALLSQNFKAYWIDVQGLGDEATLQELAHMFRLHPLAMADAVNMSTRPKTEDYDHNIFVLTELLKNHSGNSRESDQLSMFLSKNALITLQDNHRNHLEPIRERIRVNRGQIRAQGTDYLLCSLLDYALDLYYPILDETGEAIERLEQAIFQQKTGRLINEVYEKKRDLVFLRRNIWNERESVGDLIRNDSGLITSEVKMLLRDVFDHIVQIRDMIEVNHELVTGLINFYLSTMSHRLNESIKVLTIISTIFIPLTFLVGVYGMNFSPTPLPDNTTNPLNMPELYSPYGYVGFWIFSVLMTIGMVFFFRHKGWIGKGKSDLDEP